MVGAVTPRYTYNKWPEHSTTSDIGHNGITLRPLGLGSIANTGASYRAKCHDNYIFWTSATAREDEIVGRKALMHMMGGKAMYALSNQRCIIAHSFFIQCDDAIPSIIGVLVGTRTFQLVLIAGGKVHGSVREWVVRHPTGET